MHHAVPPLGGQPPRLLLGLVLSASNKGIWQKIVLIQLELSLKAIIQKEEDLRGMAKEDRLF